jgi:hypothetical protein
MLARDIDTALAADGEIIREAAKIRPTRTAAVRELGSRLLAVRARSVG